MRKRNVSNTKNHVLFTCCVHRKVKWYPPLYFKLDNYQNMTHSFHQWSSALEGRGLELPPTPPPPRLPSEFFGNFKKIIMRNNKSTPTKTSPENITLFHLPYLGSRDGTVVKALAPHQCGPGSIPGLDVICGLSLLLVLVLAPRVFLRVLRSSSLHKNQHFQIPISSGIRGPQVCRSSDC